MPDRREFILGTCGAFLYPTQAMGQYNYYGYGSGYGYGGSPGFYDYSNPSHGYGYNYTPQYSDYFPSVPMPSSPGVSFPPTPSFYGPNSAGSGGYGGSGFGQPTGFWSSDYVPNSLPMEYAADAGLSFVRSSIPYALGSASFTGKFLKAMDPGSAGIKELGEVVKSLGYAFNVYESYTSAEDLLGFTSRFASYALKTEASAFVGSTVATVYGGWWGAGASITASLVFTYIGPFSSYAFYQGADYTGSWISWMESQIRILYGVPQY